MLWFIELVGGAGGDMLFLAFWRAAGTDIQELLVYLEQEGWPFRVERVVVEEGHARGERLVARGPEKRGSVEEWRRVIQGAPLGEGKERALRALGFLEDAERAVHGKVHFHELAEPDCLLELLGCGWFWEAGGRPEVLFSTIPLGSGLIREDLPHPAPAVAHLVRGLRVRWTGAQEETVTPTAMALLRAFGEQQEPDMRVAGVYSVFGERRRLRDSFLRLWVGEGGGEEVLLLETKVDDVTGEFLAAAVEGVLEEGALDAWLVPAIGKKGRPSWEMRVLVRRANADRVAGRIMRETGTLGVRQRSVHRWTAERRIREVSVGDWRVPVKEASFGGQRIQWKPEFRWLQQHARKTGRTPWEVMLELLCHRMDTRERECD